MNVVEKEFSLTPDKTTVSAGPVAFHVVNSGAIGHDLTVIRTDLALDNLPIRNGAVDETAVQVVGKIADIAAGSTREATFVLTPGTHALICNVPAHYTAGMRMPFAVQ